MRNIISVVSAVKDDIGTLKTFRAMPIPGLQMIDPFLFLNHHGHQIYPPNNNGLPFGPHPHRGFETVTFILKGDIAHKDSTGSESVISAGGVQWMTAGSGIIHEEISSIDFKRNGGELEILQLWVNLPASLKMTAPFYRGLQKESIPSYTENGASIHLIAGKWKEHQGPFNTLTPVTVMRIEIDPAAELTMKIPCSHNIFFYVIGGEVQLFNRTVGSRSTIVFDHNEEEIKVKATVKTDILLCHAPPLSEPVVSYGPFVMNTIKEIEEAIRDYQRGKFL